MEFGYALKRLAKVQKTVEQLIQRNEELVKSNKKLRDDLATYQLRESARERVLVQLDTRIPPKT